MFVYETENIFLRLKIFIQKACHFLIYKIFFDKEVVKCFNLNEHLIYKNVYQTR
ncbi:hypothetical protein NUSPORA_02228 [Nucleospora cyclopteri]